MVGADTVFLQLNIDMIYHIYIAQSGATAPAKEAVGNYFEDSRIPVFHFNHDAIMADTWMHGPLSRA